MLYPLWPALNLPLTTDEIEESSAALAAIFEQRLKVLHLPLSLREELPRLYLPLACWLAQQAENRQPLLVGINGAQGSGKSTLVQLLAALLETGFSKRCCLLSLDDLYLPLSERQRLAKKIHPLLVTRGVPGTHDVPLGMRLFEQLDTATKASTTRIPRFDKARDDRLPQELWDSYDGRPDLILFEGWCVGAVAQQERELGSSLNALEENEDRAGIWRRYVNEQLREVYPPLFSRLDLLLMLRVPAWEMVYAWRSRQETQLAAKQSGLGVMDSEQLRRFVMHYERLTRHQLDEVPARADLLLELDRRQRVVNIKQKAAGA